MKLILAITLLCSLPGLAQNSGSNQKRDSIGKIRKMMQDMYPSAPPVFTRIRDSAGAYQNQGMYHSTYIYLYPDSAFVYYSVYEGGYDFTCGRYSVEPSKKLVLDWDSLKTRSAVKNKNVYGKYYKYCSPTPHAIINRSYTMYTDSLVRSK